MKITNKYGYPSAIVKAVENDSYSKGDSDFSITGLIQPPRIRRLTELHKDELEEDVDDCIFRLYGHMGHTLLERADSGHSLFKIIEKRYFAEIDGVKISAQIDSLSLDMDGLLIDWKVTSVYGFRVGEEPKPEWVQQMNGQLWLLKQNGIDGVKRMQIWGLLRDWRPAEKRRSVGYPNKLGFHDIPVWPEPETRAWISERINVHKKADNEIPLCSDEDNWKGRRCDGYCAVSKFCKQYQSKLKEKENERS